MCRNSLSFCFVLLLFFVAVCLANEERKGEAKVKDPALEPGAKLKLKFRRATKHAESKKQEKQEDDDGKVEVVQEKGEQKEDTTKKATKDEKQTDEASTEEDEEEEEETDPNAKIEVEELFTPKDCGNKSKNGDLVVVHYTGRLGVDGDKFDTTIDPMKGYVPFEFLLGGGTVIKGFEDGVRGMCRGQKRRIIIPPSLGYGKKGAGEIPGNTTLLYDLDLFDIRKPPPQADMFGHMDQNGDKKLSKEEVSTYMKAQAQHHYMPVHDERWQAHHERTVQNIFDHEDTDEDGLISHDEFSGPKMQAFHDEF